MEYHGIITGADKYQKSLRACRSNINNALMRDEIKVKLDDFFESSVKPNSHVVFNPPYGERMPISIDEFYQKIGDTLKHNYEGCTVWLISSDIENLKMIGLKPSRKIKVYNGKLDEVFLRDQGRSLETLPHLLHFFL